MAKVALVGLEVSAADQIAKILSSTGNDVRCLAPQAGARDFAEADIVFAGGTQQQYLKLLQATRRNRPRLPFIVVTDERETRGWLDALEYGATNYCSAPFDTRKIAWLMETALDRPLRVQVAA
jgi:DNA-binding NtrC family response regulator